MTVSIRFTAEANPNTYSATKRLDAELVRSRWCSEIWSMKNVATRGENAFQRLFTCSEFQGFLFCGIVEEPIYSGFQTKYMIHLAGGGAVTVFRQHANWSEGVPDIRWKDEVYLSWSASDSVVVESDARPSAS